MRLTEKQITFCKEVASGKSGTDAYQIAFGTKSRNTCRINASKLQCKHSVKEKIKELQAVAKSITEQSQKDIISKITLPEIMSVAERMGVLTQIARGEIPLKKPMVCDGIIQEVDVVPDWMDRKNAIAELNKMDGSYQPTKIEANVEVVKKELPPFMKSNEKQP